MDTFQVCGFLVAVETVLVYQGFVAVAPAAGCGDVCRMDRAFGAARTKDAVAAVTIHAGSDSLIPVLEERLPVRGRA